MFRERAAPAVGEVKDRHVEHQHGVVAKGAPLSKFADPGSEIILTIFPVHGDLAFFNGNSSAPGDYPAVAGFCGASFEGQKKSGVDHALR